MMKKVVKIIVISLMLIIFWNIFEMCNTSTCVVAMSDVSENANYWEPTESEPDSEFNDKVGVIVGAVRVVGILVSVITLSIIGIKFMLGSVEEKAQYKQTLIPWIIGAILLFGMTNLPSLLYDMSKGTLESQTSTGGGRGGGGGGGIVYDRIY